MAEKRSEQRDSRSLASSAWLPALFTILFSIIGLYVALFELSPAFQTHREVRGALKKQLDSEAALEADIKVKRRTKRSLEEDPQAIMHELDKRGLLDAKSPGKLRGTSRSAPDRAQSRD
jgi:hypothetical protein